MSRVVVPSSSDRAAKPFGFSKSNVALKIRLGLEFLGEELLGRLGFGALMTTALPSAPSSPSWSSWNCNQVLLQELLLAFSSSLSPYPTRASSHHRECLHSSSLLHGLLRTDLPIFPTNFIVKALQ